MSKNIDVAVGILLQTQPDSTQILIAKRPDNNVLGGFWEFPGGKIEPNETPRQCVVREFAEELGIVIAPAAALEVIEHQYPYGTVRLHPFLCRWIEGQLRNLQIAQHRWVTADDLADFSFPPANSSLIESIPRILTDFQMPAEPT